MTLALQAAGLACSARPSIIKMPIPYAVVFSILGLGVLLLLHAARRDRMELLRLANARVAGSDAFRRISTTPFAPHTQHAVLPCAVCCLCVLTPGLRLPIAE